MKRKMNFVACVCVLFLGFCTIGYAALLPLGDQYEFLYDPTLGHSPTEVPTAWKLESGTDPITSYGSGEAVNLNFTNAGIWKVTDVGYDMSAGYTLDIRMQMLSISGSPLSILVVADDGGFVEFRWQLTEELIRITVLEEGFGTRLGASYITDNDGEFHVYRFTRQNNQVSIYVDDNNNPLTTTVGNSYDANANWLSFGDGSSSVAGNSMLDYIALDIDGATFSAPIPEPATLVLISFGSLLALRTRKNT